MNDIFINNRYGDNIAVINTENDSYSYNYLFDISKYIYSYINKRTLVFCLCNNTIGALCGYFSFLNNAVVPLMLDSSLNNNLLKELTQIYQPEYLWLPNEQLADFIDSKVLCSVHEYSLIRINQKVHNNLHNNLGLLLTTSGSTGSPKLVRLSYENIQANAKSIASYLQLSADERAITSLPMHYAYGLSVINSHLIKNATILLTDLSIIQKEFWAFAKEQKATSIAGVPYSYEMLKRLRFNRMDLPHMKTLTQAGGKLSPDLVKEFVDDATEKGRKFIVMYGQTEATARMSYLPFDKAAEKYSSIGIAIPGGAFYLIDENGEKITTSDIDGELIYIGKNVSLGYSECLEDLAKGDENKGILHTGDIAHQDTDGFYYITGRMKRFIKIYGNRVNLDASEQIVKTITPDCACVGKDDKMIVYVSDQSVCNRVRTYLAEKTGLNNRAFEVRYIPEIPKNGSGKVQYTELNNE